MTTETPTGAPKFLTVVFRDLSEDQRSILLGHPNKAAWSESNEATIYESSIDHIISFRPRT